MVENPPISEGDAGSIPGPGRSPGGGNDNSFQYFCWLNNAGFCCVEDCWGSICGFGFCFVLDCWVFTLVGS